MSHVIDFSGKKVREDGKCLDKFSLCYLIDEIKPYLNMVICMECYSYLDCKNILKSVLLERNFKDIYGTQYNIK